MMRTAAVIVALFLVVWTLPAIARVDSAVRAGLRWRVAVEGARAIAAVAAASLLILFAARARP